MGKKVYKDIIIRAIKTFIQALLAYLATSLPNSDITNKTVIKSIIIGAIASSISAVMNYIIKLLNK